MYVPTNILGRAARAKPTLAPTTIGSFRVADVAVDILRYELRDFVIDGLPAAASDGWFQVLRVHTPQGEEHLHQQGGIFFTANDHPPLLELSGDEVPKGRGERSPKWHKCDRAWPADGNTPYRFVGQGYHDSMVFYLFARTSDPGRLFAVFHDRLDRQDAEEHYRLEEKLDRRAKAQRDDARSAKLPMFAKLRAWWRRQHYRPGRVLSRWVAHGVRREVLVVDSSHVDAGRIAARVRTWNVSYAATGLVPEPPFGDIQAIEVRRLWEWSGAPWGGPVPEGSDRALSWPPPRK